MGLDVFRADSHAYEAGEKSAEEWVWGEETKDAGWFDGGGVAQNLREETVDDALEGLSDAGGELAAVLDSFQSEFGDDVGGEYG